MRYRALGCVGKLKAELDAEGIAGRSRKVSGKTTPGNTFSRGALYTLLKNQIYIGKITHKGNVYDGLHEGIVEPQLWSEVQQILAQNRQSRALRVEAKEPTLLAGILFDDRGNPMSPSHANKGSRRYRYYVSQAALKSPEKEAGSVIRSPAKETEDIAIGELGRLFASDNRLLEILQPLSLSAPAQKQLVAAGKALLKRLIHGSPKEQITILKTCLAQITLAQREMTIKLSLPGLVEVLEPGGVHFDGNTPESDELITLKVPVQLKRCGVETKLIVPSSDLSNAHHESTQAIQAALGKAMKWNQSLLSGEIPTMSELAKAEGVTQRYIAHLIKLAFLAPDIMKAIHRGDIPTSLTLGRLKKDIPLDWRKQRAELGFATLA